jgi:hypothetical protein
MQAININININPQIYLAHLVAAIGGHISDLRNALRTIEDDSFSSRARQQGPNMIVHIRAAEASLGKDDTTQRAINNCFLAMTRSLITFVDRVLALKKAASQAMPNIPADVANDSLGPFVEAHLEDCYRRISEDTGLTNPKKVGMLAGLPEWIRDSMLAMFAIRRALEHHAGVAKNDIRLGLRRTILSIGDEELKNLPMEVKGGGTLSIKIVEAETHLTANTSIRLSDIDIEYLFFTLQSIIGPAILQTLAPAEQAPNASAAVGIE